MSTFAASKKFKSGTTPTVRELAIIFKAMVDEGLGDTQVVIQDDDANNGAGRLINIYTIFNDGETRIVLGNEVAEI